ncbi:hypothetical protein ABMA27_008237 [Loxostege sticticalis]|uniref:Integrase catalytic domain-containing protein n=1 Tax=Loxostege sticticalis TaxID=481309 RepID=A0ABR3HAL3_LOXSC
MAELKALEKKRRTFKSKLTSFSNYLKLLSSGSSLSELQRLDLEERFYKFDGMYTEFDALQGEIEMLAEDPEAVLKEREDFERQYFSQVALARSLLGIVSKGSVSGSNQNTNAPTNQNLIRLPQINLPTFDGNYQYWLEFRDTFVSLIHNNSSIDDINKFHYLRASLQGNAALIIKNIDFSGENYKSAWDLLCERFNNNRLLIDNHLQAIFDVEPVLRESSISLRNLVDVTNKNIRPLKTLKQPTEHWNTLLIFILAKKLDITTNRHWEEYRNELSTDPTLAQFCTFVGRKADLLESIETNQSLSNNNILVALNNSHSNLNNKQIQDIKYENQRYKNNKNQNNQKTRNLNTKPNFINCPLCSQRHSLFSCESFRALPIENRIQKAKDFNVCQNYLRPGHYAKQCKLTHCKYCKIKHNTLLHLESPDSKPFVNPLPSAADGVTLSATSLQVATSAHVLLSTALVNVLNSSGEKHTARLLLDNGSTDNFVTQSLCDKLGLSRRGTSTKVTGINNHISSSTQSCHLTIESLCCAYNMDIVCHVLPEITKVLPSSFVNISHVPIPPGLQLADPNFNIPSVIDILVGAEVFWSVLGSNSIDLGKNLPKLCETKFGWLVSGSISRQKDKPSLQFCNFANSSPDSDLSRFWELDHVSPKHSQSLEERSCEKHFLETTFRKDDGRFVVSMPLKQDPSLLGHSYEHAKCRFLSLERRFQSDPVFKDRYFEFMHEYETLGHMSLDKDCATLPDSSKSSETYFIPHHGVIRESSSTTKLRVVFDASAATSSGLPLNDLQMVGPVVQDDLFSILIRFRQHKYVVSGDVEKMYRAIEINPIQRPLQKIIFRFDTKEPLKTYTLNTVTYGTASAPYLATKCLVSLADDIEDSRVKSAIQRDFYVDDFLHSARTFSETVEVSKQVASVLSSAQFHLRKWKSNCPEILSQICGSQSGNPTNTIDFSEQGQGNTQSKTLGLHWNCNTDMLTFSINIEPSVKITKRHVLSVISQIFDPLGLVGPCVVEAKIIMQRLWLDKYDWDDTVSLEIKNLWSIFEHTLPQLNKLNIPRWISFEESTIHEVHIFTDASEKAYGACLYIRSYNSHLGTTRVQLMASKNRIAPIKPTTIPRLELCGALLGSRLCTKVVDSLTLHIDKCRFWCDSTIVLGWLSTPSTQLKPFVRNRVNEIQESTCGHTWSYVPSKDNPADLVSRGIRADVIGDTHLWWSGPSFLLKNENEWPTMPNVVKPDLSEVVSHVISSSGSDDNASSSSTAFVETNINVSIIQNLTAKYSSFTKLQRVVAYLCRFLHNLKNKNDKLCGNLSLFELKKSHILILQCAQLQMFPDEYKLLQSGKTLPHKNRLISLTPFVDTNGLIRVGGRLDNSPYDFDSKHPILLCSSHVLTKLIFQMQHIKLLHAGPQLLLASIRQTYWPLKGKNLSKLIVKKCVICFRHRAQNVQPIMGQLPLNRTQLEFPFQNCHVDYAGPVLIADRKGRGCKLNKSYLCIFVCSAVKAVHLELVTDLTTEAYMAALYRFVARRGKPRSITSDNGTNFVGASNDMQSSSGTIGHHRIAWAAGTMRRCPPPHSASRPSSAPDAVPPYIGAIKSIFIENIL